MPDTAHPIAPRGLSPITELTTPRSLRSTLPNDDTHPSYASVREGGSDRSSVYSQTSGGSGGTITPRARKVSLPRSLELGPPLCRPALPALGPNRNAGNVDPFPTTSPRRSHRTPFPSPSQQPGGLPPPPRRRGTPPPTSPTRSPMDRPHSWQPRSRLGSGPIEEESQSHYSDPSVHSSALTAGQAGIGARSNFEVDTEQLPQLETWAEVLSPASTLLAPRPSLRLSHSSPAISRGIEPTPSPPVPQVELLSQSLKVSPDATPPISPAGSLRFREGRSANLLRKRAKSVNGKRTSPILQGTSERPRSVVGTTSIPAGSSVSLGKRQPTPPRRESSLSPSVQSRATSRPASITTPSTRTRKGSKRTSRKNIVSSFFSIFDSSRKQPSQASLDRANGPLVLQSTGSEELLGVEPQIAIRTSGTFGVRDDGSVLEDPNKSPRSLVHSRIRTESGPALSALSAATSGLSGSGSAKSMGAGRVLYVQNSGRPSEEKADARGLMETVMDAPPRTPITAVPIPPVPTIASSHEQGAIAADTAASNLPRPGRARRDISKGSSTSDHTFGEASPGQSNPSPERRGSLQSHSPPNILGVNPISTATLPSLELGQSGRAQTGSARASPTRPLPRPPSASSSPRPVAPSTDLWSASIANDPSNRPLSDTSNQGSDSITPRASQIPQSPNRDALVGPMLNIPAPPSVSPGPSRESSWYAPAPDETAMRSDSSTFPSDQAEIASAADERRQGGPDTQGQTFQADYMSLGDVPPRHRFDSDSQAPHHASRTPLPTSGSSTDLPFLIASHVLSTHAAQLMQQSTSMHEVSEAIRRMAKESLDWGGMLMRLSEESRTGRPAQNRRPVSMPQSFPAGLDNLRDLLEHLHQGEQSVPPVPDLPEPYRSSSRPVPPPPVPTGAHDPLYDAWLRLHGQRPPTVYDFSERPTAHDPFSGFPDYRHLSAYHHAQTVPPTHPTYQPYRPETSDTAHPQTPGPRAQRQRRTQSLEYPLEWVREADRLGMEGWSNLHQAEEAWHVAMGFLRRVVEEGHDLATPGRSRPYTNAPATTEYDAWTGGRGWRYYQPHSRFSAEYDRPQSRVYRQPSPPPKVGSTRASTPSRYGPEGSGPPAHLPPLPFSPILESSESAHRYSSFSRPSPEGRQREMSFLPQAEDMVSLPRSHTPSFRRSDIKSRRVLGTDEIQGLGPRSQSYTLPVPRLRPDLGVPFSQSVGPGVMVPLSEPAEDFARPTHGRQRSTGPTSTIGSTRTRRKLRKGIQRNATGGTLRTMGSGTMRSRTATPTFESTRRKGPVRAQRHGSRTSFGSRGSRSGSGSGSDGGHRVRPPRPPSPPRKRHWWSRRR